ncbi:MAG TPA: flagellar hook-associated protein FlgL [Eoetvoesiella sp.]|uniref:flagellar hook-associated protein FlgL n=1 Tax=Eoetvoesiella sp. TaxID=1966355 RepID=UPI002D1B5AD9|nr:flagellar hook-associated protein FlgL [Eoetvoesiella sp.]HWK59920.1 flagellar hook-associated protein FlgL [Eoetvoesiella sp.]
MRISSNLFFQTGLNSINAQQSDLMHLYQQVASGQRMVTPADDPLAAAQAINLSQAQTLNQRFADNREVAKGNLGTEENTLSSVTTLLQDIKTRLIEAGNGTMSDADRATLSNVLKNSKDTLLGLANATDGNGQYLFSGYSGSQPAFVVDASGKVTYNGDANQRLIQADQTRQIAGSDIGSDIFMRASTGARNYMTSADSANTGTGLIGKPVVTDAQGANVGKAFEIEFSNSGTPPVLQYTINVKDASGNTVSSSAPTDYVAGTVSLDLGGGVKVDFSGAPAAGDKFAVEPANSGYAASVQLTDPSAANIDPTVAGKATVTDATAQYFGKPFTVEFDAADPTKFTTTFYSDSSLATPLGTVDGTFTPPGGATDIPGAGVSLDITGTPQGGDKITVQAPQPTDLNIFDTLDSVIAALDTPASTGDTEQTAFLNTLAGAIQRIDLNYNQVLTVRSSIGSRLNELDAIDSNGTLRNLGYTQQLSRLEDVDYYSATAQLQLRQSALEAAALAFKQIQGTSLFNMGSN